LAQYITPTYVTFSSEWDKLAEAASMTETFALSSLESLKGVWSVQFVLASVNMIAG
jgi:hypothetical protein